MRDSDLGEFSGMLDAVCSLLSRGAYTPSAPNTAMWFRSLRDHSLDAVRAGFDAHVTDPQRGRFVPVPADIISQIEGLVADDGRPGAEEAWALTVKAADESNTVVWTREMMEAWRIASPVFDGGDEVGARMAFKETYQRLVDTARRGRITPVWEASLGHDKAKRDQVLAEASRLGRIEGPKFLHLPGPSETLVTLAASTSAAPHIREMLLAQRDLMKLRLVQSGPEGLRVDERTKELKATAAARVAEATGGALHSTHQGQR